MTEDTKRQLGSSKWYRILILLLVMTVQSDAEVGKWRNLCLFTGRQDEIDTLQSQVAILKKPHFGVYVLGIIGLGNHDNLTKVRPDLPNLVTAPLYVRIDLRFGVTYGASSLIPFISHSKPITRSSRDSSGLIHQSGLFEAGLMYEIRFFSPRSFFNLAPIVGYKWFWEGAKISDNDDQTPDVMYEVYQDNGVLAGGEINILLSKRQSRDYRLTFIYTFENLSDEINRYRIEWRKVSFPADIQKTNSGIDILDVVSYWSIGIEYLTWSSGREDWYVVASFGTP